MARKRGYRETVPLRSSLTLQLFVMIKPHFRRNRDVWSSVGLLPFRMPSPKAQGPPRVLAPRQEFSGGCESAKVVLASNNGDDGSVLKLWDDSWT